MGSWDNDSPVWASVSLAVQVTVSKALPREVRLPGAQRGVRDLRDEEGGSGQRGCVWKKDRF